MITIGKIMAKYPPAYNGGNLATMVLREHPEFLKEGAVYLDMWPILPPILYVFDPDMSAQFTTIHSLPKAKLVKDEFKYLTGNKDLVTLDGQEWKRWRSILNPGFSAKNIVSMIPALLEEVAIFKDFLRKVAKTGEVFPLEKPLTDMTMDVIVRAAV